jgi:GNAT superfamily N-acetyltransferase
MVILDRKNYDKVLGPLVNMKLNNLFARMVAERKVTGSIFVDREDEPRVFHIVHPYGMSLLIGDSSEDAFNSELLDYMLNARGLRKSPEWLQAYPGHWNALLACSLGSMLVAFSSGNEPDRDGLVEENTRVNFRFNREKYMLTKENLDSPPLPLRRVDKELFVKMKGTVVPGSFWDNAQDFLRQGAGFSFVINGDPVSTAYSAYVIDNQLELGIETLPAYRGRGLALFVCSALIDYCLESGYEPVWSCRLENSASYRLALKLGFEPVRTWPYYRLPV